VPADEVEILDEHNGLDADAVKQRDGIAWPDVEKGHNYAAHICANFYDAFYACDFVQPLDRCLQRIAVALDEVELALVFGDLLSLTMRLELCDVALLNKAQHCDGTCLKIHGIETSPLDVAAKEGQYKVLSNVVQRLVGCERTEPLSHVRWNLSKNSQQNMDRLDGANGRRHCKNVLHGLHIGWNMRFIE
jgi:hypothetical protein